jgi:hypothetical protein
MPYTFKWTIEGRVVECTMSGELTLDDMRGLRRDIVQDYLRYGKPPAVHGLIDINDLEKTDFTVNEVLQVPGIEEQVSANFEGVPAGWRLYFGSDVVMFRFAMTLFHESKGHPARWFATREAALEFLCAEDDTLDCG